MSIYRNHTAFTEVSEKNIPLSDMRIQTLEDGSVWARLHWLDVAKEATYFATAEVPDYAGTNRFSKMKLASKLYTSSVKLKNVAPKINGTTGFATGAANNAEGWHKYSAASFQLTGTGSSEVTAQSSAATVPLVNGHTYYARVEIKQSSKQGTGEMFLGGSTAGGGVAAPNIIAAQAVSAANVWTSISGLTTRTFPTGNHKFRLDYNNGASGSTMCFDGLVIIDLTEAFGAGSEPTKAWCDSNIPYFEKEIIIDASGAGYKRYEFMLKYPSMVSNIYNKLEYIKSTGTQYIDTGLTTNQNTTVVVKAKYTANYSIYGAGQAYTNFTAGGAGGYFYYNGYDPGSSPAKDYKNVVRIFKQDKNKCYVDGKLIHTFPTATFTSPGNLFLFGRNASGALNDAGGEVSIYYCKIYQNGVLVRDFIPCQNMSTKTIGLLDKVNNVFYTNKGSGTFTAGTAQKTIISDLYNRWTQTGSPEESAPGGYQRITTAWTGHAGPLRKSSGAALYNCDNVGTTTWFAAIGQTVKWSDAQAIPAADGTSQTETELWVRIDNLSPAAKANIYKDGYLNAGTLYEL